MEGEEPVRLSARRIIGLVVIVIVGIVLILCVVLLDGVLKSKRVDTTFVICTFATRGFCCLAFLL